MGPHKIRSYRKYESQLEFKRLDVERKVERKECSHLRESSTSASEQEAREINRAREEDREVR